MKIAVKTASDLAPTFAAELTKKDAKMQDRIVSKCAEQLPDY